MANNYFGMTDPGKVRTNNEDTFIAEPVFGGHLTAACVIDGVGGYNGGEVAAAIAHDVILEHLKKGGTNVVAVMKKAFEAANDKIKQQRKITIENKEMACVLTLALADVIQNKFYYAHVGDTRLYLLRDHSLVKISKDHSFVGFLEDNGRLSEEAAMRHPKRNEINKALGFDTEINGLEFIETGSSPFLPGDLLLLCSDGLSDMISNAQMTVILNSDVSLAEKASALIKAANNAGGNDNITVALVHNNKPIVKQQSTRPLVSLRNTEDTTEDDVLVKPVAASKAVLPVKKRSGAVPVLLVLCFLLLSAFYGCFTRVTTTKTPISSNL